MLLIEKLRKETQAYHNKLDSHPILSRITTDGVELSDYIAYLKLFYGIHSILESEIKKHLAESIQFEGRLSAIKHDLSQYNQLAKLANTSSFELSKTSALGAYYVIEGSKLGGKMIGKRLSQNLGLKNDEMNFLMNPSSYSWKSVIDQINEVSSDAHHDVIEGAKQTFSFIHDYVNEFYAVEG
tara:strand:+ start:24995 stop:25543 length:549 start_codon:yes stop_codon:yes gene_type:complete